LEVVENVVRTRSGRRVKKARISLSYHRQMERKRNEDLRHRAKPKVARLDEVDMVDRLMIRVRI
jgi:hypothetical protein